MAFRKSNKNPYLSFLVVLHPAIIIFLCNGAVRMAAKKRKKENEVTRKVSKWPDWDASCLKCQYLQTRGKSLLDGEWAKMGDERMMPMFWDSYSLRSFTRWEIY